MIDKNYKKRWYFMRGDKLTILGLFLLILSSIVLAEISHPAAEILPGEFPAGDYKFTGYVNVTDKLHTPEVCLDGDCQTSWAVGGGSTYWNLTGENLFPSNLSYKVGIAKTNPEYTLDVGGYVRAARYYVASGWAEIRPEIDADRTIYFNSTTSNLNGGWAFIHANQSNMLMKISNNGNVGIGTTAPTNTLEVTGSQYPSIKVDSDQGVGGDASVYLTGDRDATGALGRLSVINRQAGEAEIVSSIDFYRDGADDAGDIRFFTQPTGDALTSRMVITSDGEIGIGTTNPESKLQITEDIDSNFYGLLVENTHVGRNAVVEVRNTWTNMSLGQDWLTTTSRLFLGGGTYMSLNTNGTEQMRITAGGNVGIGTTNPSSKLDVNGSIYSNQKWIWQQVDQSDSSNGEEKASLHSAYSYSNLRIAGKASNDNYYILSNPTTQSGGGSNPTSITYKLVGKGINEFYAKGVWRNAGGNQGNTTVRAYYSYDGINWTQIDSDSGINPIVSGKITISPNNERPDQIYIRFNDTGVSGGSCYQDYCGWQYLGIDVKSQDVANLVSRNILGNLITISANGNVGISQTTPNSTLQVGDPTDGNYDYTQIDAGTSAPPAGHCTTANDRGRMWYKYDTDVLYICDGSSWQTH